ncbi:MAG TPA: dienelactone hydrolase family protein [Psychromonas sp.]
MRLLIYLILGLLFMPLANAGGEYVNYQVAGKSYQGYFVNPSPDAPLVLLLHDWDGLTDYEVKRAEMLADLGYAVFAADLFGEGVRPTEIKDKQQHTGALYKDRQKLRDLIKGAYDFAIAKGAPANNTVVMGYCFGGAAVLEFARSGIDVKGFVTFHGGLETPAGQDYKNTKGKLLIFHGSADTFIPMQVFASLANQLEASGVEHEMTTYSGAPHAFTVFGTESYREDADKKSWKRFIEFLDTTLK